MLVKTTMQNDRKIDMMVHLLNENWNKIEWKLKQVVYLNYNIQNWNELYFH